MIFLTVVPFFVAAFMRETNMHRNSDEDKVILVKAGLYKAVSEVPDSVP